MPPLSQNCLIAVWLFALSAVVPAHDLAGAEPKVAAVNQQSVAAYILACQKADGAYGPRDQHYTDAAWTYPAVHALRLLGEEIANPAAIAEHGLGYPRGHAGYGHWLTFHQSMIRRLLDLPRAKGPARLAHQGYELSYYGTPFGNGSDQIFDTDGQQAAEKFQAAEQLGFYNLSSLYYLLMALAAEGREVANPGPLVDFITARQAPGGGFVDLRTADGVPEDAAHVARTLQAVASLYLLEAEVPRPSDVARFVLSCRQKSGGFGFHPNSEKSGNFADIYYTYCALQTLSLLDQPPASPAKTAAWINSLQNHDGGFGDQPQWRSRLYSTYYAVHALALLAETQQSDRVRPAKLSRYERVAGLHMSGLANTLVAQKQCDVPLVENFDPQKFQIYQGLFKTPVLETADLTGLSQRGFNLLAMKTDDFAKATELQIPATLPLSVILCPEAYPHRARQADGALLNHVGNFTLDPSWNDEQLAIWNAAHEAGQQALAWDEYCRQVLKPLQQLGCLCYPEQDFEMEYAYAAYDAGLAGQHGYNAVQAGFNWAPRDFVRVFPWRERYTDKLPMIADADAHGDLQKWSPQLDHVRHLYLSASPSYASFQDAARSGRVVCVAVPPSEKDAEVALYGPPAAVRFVRERMPEWKWWGN